MSLAVIVDVKELANKDNPGTNKRKSFYMFLQMQYRTSAVEKMKVHPTMILFMEILNHSRWWTKILILSPKKSANHSVFLKF